MSDQRANAGQAASSALHTTNESLDQGKLLPVACVVGLAFAVGIGLIWGQWLPLLVLICSLAVVWMAATHSRSQARSATACSAGGSRSFAGGNRDSDLRMIGNVFAVCLAGVTLIAIAARFVQRSCPRLPHEANPIALLDSGNYSRATVKVYFPDLPLSFGPATEMVPQSPRSSSEH